MRSALPFRFSSRPACRVYGRPPGKRRPSRFQNDDGKQSAAFAADQSSPGSKRFADRDASLRPRARNMLQPFLTASGVSFSTGCMFSCDMSAAVIRLDWAAKKTPRGNRQAIAIIGMAAAMIAGLAPEAASARPITSTKYQYYSINGATALEIYKAS